MNNLTDIQSKDFENLKMTLENYGEDYNYELIEKAFVNNQGYPAFW